MLLRYGKERIRESLTDDRLLIRFYQLKSELDRIINLYFERLIGFGAFAGMLVEDMEPCELFRKLPDLVNIKDATNVVNKTSQAGKLLCELRSDLVTYMREGIRKVMPNVSSLAGDDLALDLLASGRSLENLAQLPASTIQILGAEKSFFKHLRTGTPPPKHGVIFKFPSLNTLPRDMRGKYSRTAASKIAIAARADYMGSSLDVESMKNDMQTRLAGIREISSSRARPGKKTSHRGSRQGRNR